MGPRDVLTPFSLDMIQYALGSFPDQLVTPGPTERVHFSVFRNKTLFIQFNPTWSVTSGPTERAEQGTRRVPRTDTCNCLCHLVSVILSCKTLKESNVETKTGKMRPKDKSPLGPECDVPVPGIFHFFWWYRNRYRKKLVPEKSLGTGI